MTEIIPINSHELGAAIGKLFASYPSAQRQGAKPQAYVEALARIPTSFAIEACRLAAKGRLGDAIPSSAALCRLAMVLHSRSLEGRKDIPELPLQHTPDQRKRIVQGFRELIADLKSGKKIEPELATAKVFTVFKEES